MFSMPTSFSDFFVKSLKTVPYVAVFNGAIFSIIGVILIYSGSNFTTNSEKTQLHVLTVESRRGDNGIVYKPTFEALGSDGKSIQYSGNSWVSPKPHEEGDIVDGRVNWTTGEIRSTDMIISSASLGKTATLLGSIIFLLGTLYIWRKRINAS